MKSTAPGGERTRSSMFPRAPAHTSASAAARGRSAGAVARYSCARITRASSASPLNTMREYGPTSMPNEAPGLYASVNCTQSPTTARETYSGTRYVTASDLVVTSSATTTRSSGQNSAALGLLLSIFLALLVLDAQARMRKRVEPVEVDVLAALLALAEGLWRPVQAAERLVDVPEEATLLGCEQKSLLPLHGVGALICHMERVRSQVAVRRLRSRVECLAVVAQLLEHALPLLEQSLLEVRQHLLGHGLGLLRAR